MSSNANSANFVGSAKYGALAGMAGGVAEVVWIAVYAATTGSDAAEVARGVASAVGITTPAAATELGIGIHLVLAVALGMLLSFGWQAMSACLRYSPGAVVQFTTIVGALLAVWVINFFVILPFVSPDFVQVVPYQTSLVSKLLFGLAAVLTFRQTAWQPVFVKLRTSRSDRLSFSLGINRSRAPS